MKRHERWLHPAILRSPLSLGRRLYHMGWLAGLLTSLPLLTLAGWYSWSAYAELDRYRRAAHESVAIDVELFQIVLHDTLARDLARMLGPHRAAESHLRTLSLSLPGKSLDAVMAARPEAPPSWVAGTVKSDEGAVPVEVRRRGARPAHWLGTQKSLKLRAERGDLVLGSRIFNLINDPAPFGLWPYVALGVAKDQGLLTPDLEPVRVRINNVDMGVFRYEAQPDEGLLRRQGRMPGSLFSGDGEEGEAPKTPLGLFGGRTGWKKVAWQSDDRREDYSELDELLAEVSQASHEEFARFAATSIDLDRYALFDALDVVFGSEEHDYTSNHKIYLDPFTGRFEPIAWGFDQFAHEESFNVVDHPLLIRLKMTPGYLERRDRQVYELLTGPASIGAVRARLEALTHDLGSELAEDPFWDAYKLLPSITRFHRYLLRPMTQERWRQVLNAELASYARRSRYLLAQLEQVGVEGRLRDDGGGIARVELTAFGEPAYALQSIEVASRCAGSFALHADRDGDGRLDARTDPLVAAGRYGKPLELSGAYTHLAAGLVLERRDDEPRRGPIRAAREPRRYAYLLRGDACDAAGVTAVTVTLENLATGAISRLPLGVEDVARPPVAASHPRPAALPVASAAPSFAPGEHAPHPWSFAAETAPATIKLGPGVVRFAETRTFAPNEAVRIVAGTQLLLGPGVSLVFNGPVAAVGTEARPITIASADPAQPFGAVIVQGPASRHSLFSHVQLRGGVGARLGLLDAPAMLNIYSTTDVVLEAVSLTGGGGDDAIHATYVDGLVLTDATVSDAASDAVDLEHTRAVVDGLRVFRAGDDCLDLMGTELRLSNTALRGCKNNGIGAGEETHVIARDTFIGHARIGVLSKNASRVELTRVVLFDDRTALEARRHEIRYAGESRIEAGDIFVVGCRRLDRDEHGSHVVETSLKQRWPDGDTLGYLRGEVLHVRRWQELESDPFAQTAKEDVP